MCRSALTLLAAGALLAGVLGPTSLETRAFASPSEAVCVPASTCCRICDDGQACGNSCISRKKNCHKGRGCACNASELCPASASAVAPDAANDGALALRR